MKLQIVQLEPHDDLVSARDRLRAVKADRVLLVWPRHGRILQRRLDLALLRREAEAKGLVLGLLTHDPRVRDNAVHEHLPVFDHLKRLPEERWQRAVERQAADQRRLERPDPAERHPDLESRKLAAGRVPIPRTTRWIALATVALPFVALAVGLLPSAEVVIDTRAETRSATLSLMLAASTDPSSPASLPGQNVRATLSASAQAPTTGSQGVPAEPARGTLQFTNLTDEAIDLPAGTSARPSSQPDLYFVTLEPATLPARAGAQVIVPAAPAIAGTGGNLDAERIDAVDGPLGLDVTVTNPEPFEGGTDSRRSAVRQQDLDDLRQLVLDDLQAQATDRLRSNLSTDQRLALATVHIDQVLSESFDAEAGDLAPDVSLHMEAEATGMTYRSVDLERAADQTALNGLRRGWEVVPGSVRLDGVHSRTQPDGSTLVQARVTWRSAQAVDPAAVRDQIVGLPIDVARRKIQAMPGATLVSLQIWPTWFPRVPWTAPRIAVVPAWKAR